MHNTKKITYRFTMMAMIAVVALAWQSQANRNLAPSSPTVLVSVDFERAFSALEERTYEESKAQATIDLLKQNLDKQRQHIESYEQEFEFYEPNSEKWQELAQQQQLEALEYQAQVEYIRIRSEREASKGLRSVYEHIREACATLAKQHGWDYVFVNDAIVAFPEGNNVDMAAQISYRRMLYANPVLDVTDTIIEYMNASFDGMAVR